MTVSAVVANGTIFVGDPDATAGVPAPTAFNVGDSIELEQADFDRLLACGVLVNPATQIVPIADSGGWQVVPV